MSLKLYYHPLASFCWKVLVALYENETAFEPIFVDLSSEASSAELKRLWPIGKFPVLRDDARNATLRESSSIIEYLDQHYPGKAPLVPRDPDRAREMRFRDRFFDQYVHQPMQKIVTDRIRPAGKTDPYGVEEARDVIATAYALLESELAPDPWALGAEFGMADCAAAPAVYYANRVAPLGDAWPKLAAYLRRLMERPSFARTLREAEPYFKYFPG